MKKLVKELAAGDCVTDEGGKVLTVAKKSKGFIRYENCGSTMIDWKNGDWSCLPNTMAVEVGGRKRAHR